MKTFLLLLVAFLLVGCAPASTPQPAPPQEAQVETTESLKSSSRSTEAVVPAGQSVEIIGGDEASLREFIQRWLAPVYPGAPGGMTTVRIGEMPADLSVDVPLPKGARIAGSVQQPESYTQIILDANLTPAQVTEFYSQTLSSAGWQPAPKEPQGGGFVGSTDFPARYCLREDEAYLEIWSLEKPEGMTDVRLNLYAPAQAYFCQEREAGSMDEGMSLIPALEAPSGTRMMGGGSGSSGDGSSYISSDLESSLSAEELLEHYNAQLVSAGWELVEQGTTPVVSWSTWKLTDKNGKAWGGTLFIMEGQLNPEKRLAMLSVERAP